MRRLWWVPGLMLGAIAIHPATASADHNADVHSDNVSLVANFDDGGTYRQGSDLAFWRNTAVLGNYLGLRLADVSRPSRPREIGQLDCPGPQNDVSVWEDLVFMSVDSPRRSDECGAGSAPLVQTTTGGAWEGIRIVSIADRSQPEQIATVRTECGSHTHTLVPDEEDDRVLLYVLSYPLGGQGVDCNVATHRKISVVEVPLEAPAEAKVISQPDVSPAIGCHDVTVFPDRKLALAACISESQVWDISDPEEPTILSHIVNPAINIHHSAAFSWDGNTGVIGDELGGSAFSPGCVGGDQHTPLGALWFYDLSDPEAPVVRGTFRIPQQEVSIVCTAHNYNVVPLRSDRDVLVSGWRHGGTTVVDFTDPANPEQLGFYIAKTPSQSREEPVRSNSWSSYWYNGFIYSSNFDAFHEDDPAREDQSRGLDVLAIDDPVFADAAHLNRLNPQTQELFPGANAR